MRYFILLLLLCITTYTKAARVEAGSYDSFWLWAGVKPQPALRKAKTIYILQGQIDEVNPKLTLSPRMKAQGPSPSRLNIEEVWLVYRSHTLAWDESTYKLIHSQLTRWKHSGSQIKGIQIDFDAQTLHLNRYAEFLHELRLHLPTQYKLSITGLLDWSNNADTLALNALSDVVDEVVMQTYQGRHTIPEYERYLSGLTRLKLPFKIGLIQNGLWNSQRNFESNPFFRGYVIFLLNPPG